MDDSYNIIAIDPGNNIGIAIYTISAIDNSILSITTRTVVLDMYINNDVVNIMLYRLNILNNLIAELYNIYQPVAIGLEASFMNSRFPKAVIQLSQYVAIIETSFIKHNCFIKLFKYAPKYIKSKIGAGGDGNKYDMLANMNSIAEIITHVNTSYLTEHEIDALSIGYVMLTDIRYRPHLLFTI